MTTIERLLDPADLINFDSLLSSEELALRDTVRGFVNELGVVKHLDSSAVIALLGHPLLPAAESIRTTARSLIDQRLV